MVKNVLKTAALSFGIAVLFAGVALAHGSGSGPATKAVKLVLKGTGATAGVGNTGSDGQCVGTGDPWVDNYTCSGSGNCSCIEVTARVSGNGLKGGSVSDFFITSDSGINPVTVTPVSPGPTPQCNLILGALTGTDSSSNVTTLNLVGVSCKKLIGVSSHNPSGSEPDNTMSGGWGVSSTPKPTQTISGWGTFTGTNIKAANSASLTLSGWITK
ncbi:MAG: hypothetical protein WCE23_04410 [Candidatus Binatus sp.]|uniref:hypothetical protein n=1 Tax=Candidatus Binatus sp. TaxID=2811406 RepID=UPI003C77ADC0